MRTFIIPLALFAALPAAAEAEGPYQINRDGMRFEYRVTTGANGVGGITGTDRGPAKTRLPGRVDACCAALSAGPRFRFA